VADLPLDRLVGYLLARNFDAAELGQPQLFPDYYEDLCHWMRRRCDLPLRFPDPRQFAVELDVWTVCEPVSGCYGEINEGDDILYSSRGGPRAWGLRIYHGLAHWILRKHYRFDYTEADAWLLTIELACPAWYLRQVGPEQFIAENEHVPEWLAWQVFLARAVAA
jgi:hypothetical protein